MKHVKRLMSAMLVLAMVLTMSLTAFADETKATYSITINNTNSGHTYEAYQIFTGTLYEKTEGDTVTKYLSDIAWGSGVTNAGKTALGDAAEVAATLKDETAAKDFAKTIAGYLTTPAGTDDYDDNAYEITGLEAGYYLVKDKNDSLDGENDAYTGYILEVVSNVIATPKTGTVTSWKKVDDINDSNTTQDAVVWEDSADYDIGDAVPFRLSATVPGNYDSYTKYQLTFHDTESAGLAFDKESVKVYIDDSTTAINSSLYTVNVKGEEGSTMSDANCTFEVHFDDLKKIDAVKANSTVHVVYTSKLDTDAVLGSAGNPNEMYTTYSNDIHNSEGGETGKTPVDQVIVFTYKTVINKVDGDNKALAGAEFKLEKYVNGVWKVIKMDSVIDEKTTTFTFTGIDDGLYCLTETVTPAGYNSIDPIYFEVEATHDIEAPNPGFGELNVTQTDKDANETTGEAATFKVALDASAGTITSNIVNQSGFELPSTGGVGTTLFYIIGGVLVVGAVVLLITKKRMGDDN